MEFGKSVWRSILAVGFLGSLLCGGAFSDNQVTCDSVDLTKPCKVTETGLELRVLTKPQSQIYIAPDVNSGVKRSGVPAFEGLYVYEQKDIEYDQNNFAAKGWFGVGASPSGIEGYMRAEDVVLWKTALTLAYTNPGVSERKPVLMYDSRDSLYKVMTDIKTGSKLGDQIYAEVGSTPPPPGLISREANGWLDIEKQFYLLPILQFSDFSEFNEDAGMFGLQLAAVTNQARSDQAQACDIRKADNADCFQKQAGSGPGNLALDVKFVIDMTSSMQPHIDAVTKALREVVQGLQQKNSNLKFGLIGYRDDIRRTPGLEWVTKNFTPQLLDSTQFAELISTVKVTSVGSEDNEEEVFAGLKSAILGETSSEGASAPDGAGGSTWSEKAARLIILIGDAPSHPVGHVANTTNMAEQAIRELADQEKVSVAMIYVGSSTGNDADLARQQYKVIAAGQADGENAFAEASGGGETGLETSLRTAIGNLFEFLQKGNFGAISSSNVDTADATAQSILGAARAGLVDYLGSEATPPSNLTAWVVDRDMTDPKKKNFDIKVLVTKQDLEEMSALLEGLMTSFQSGQQGSVSFFGGGQAVGTAASFDLKISEKDAIMTSEAVPQFIKNLPYKSDMLSMTVEEFKQASPDDRARFEQRIDALIKFYGDQLNRDTWVALNENDAPERKVYMLDLANLP